MNKRSATSRETLIRTQYSRSGTESVIQFFTGAIDFAYVGVTPFVMARHFGVPIRVIGLASQFGKSHAVIGGGHRIRRRFLRVGVVWGSTAHYVGYEWSKSISQPVAFVNIGAREQMKALSAGFVDAISCWEPHARVAEQRGFRRLYNATELPTPSYNFLCATEKFIQDFPKGVRALAAAHKSGVRLILDEDDNDFAEYLATVFEASLPPQDFLAILKNHYTWCHETFFSPPDVSHPVWSSLRASELFLRHTNQIQNDSKLAEAFGSVPDMGNWPDSISVGYSDSLMCAPLHAAISADGLTAEGLRQDASTRLTSERIAQLEPIKRRTLSRAQQLLLDFDVRPAVLSIGTLHEAVISQLYQQAFTSQPPSTTYAQLGKLDKEHVLPPRMLAGAHFIRSLRNAATHDPDHAVSREDGLRALDVLIDIVEFGAGLPRPVITNCSNCSQALRSEWLACPFCGAAGALLCAQCNQPLRQNWLCCPACGTRTQNTAGVQSD